ncbi:(2Fe-2S)-binding protein [Leucobacter komagatae]|uniref:(2Fe-2S)-binding protein n=1 Tax=Leucobacter komagatae TaxID=55969 RepID=UPI0005AC72AE|nr:(2Fe-2S)-binding protein [Leucobacter komagatae]
MSTNKEPSPGGKVQASFEGEPLTCAPGASVAAALIATGKNAWRETRSGASRGLFCGIGVCFDCLVEIDGESGQRACMIPLADGMDVRRATGPGAGDHSGEASVLSAGEGDEA